jgi:hypothetical protein
MPLIEQCQHTSKDAVLDQDDAAEKWKQKSKMPMSIAQWT